MCRQQFFHRRNGYLFFQLNGERLAVTAQRADAHAQTINRDHRGSIEDLVGFRLAFPLFAALAVIKLFVDPGDQASRQRYAKVINRQLSAAGQCRNFAFNIKNCGRRRRQFIGDMAIQLPHLG
ncbi:Uncharacterised protein [Salmonella enterica subsp. enterica serovar Bovismorbificans]|uniref:Uncharacterized protein n=1 Tax=Salmonella enterica subsp. enterica serovar Bovismorbificans TaxID=58097 RepID=A0A655CD55_SALET|nr:Uncharacterised protein [Salmonella enterica subsp. enterica serovar Bovismorbificans]